MCDCNKLCNEELAKSNMRLKLAFTMKGVLPNALIETERIDNKKKAGHFTLTAAYCPFCGEEYPYQIKTNLQFV